MRGRQTWRIVLLCIFFLPFFPGVSPAGSELIVAVAANFAPAMEELSEMFTQETNIPVQVTVSSSGRLYAQIRNGAPFDLFFSADRKRPERLFQGGYCEKPVRYARGFSILWSRNEALCRGAESWQDMVNGSGQKTIGMANPELAPYGAVIREVLVEEQLWYALEDRLVYGANVGQSFQYAATGATEASFIALSLVHTPTGDKGCFRSVPEARPVDQDACVVRAAKNREAARDFLTFVMTKEGGKILRQHGYGETAADAAQ